MTLNDKFMHQLTFSFRTYLNKDARSNEKLKNIHAFITETIKNQLNNDTLTYYSLSNNSSNSKEFKVMGRYMDKLVDIAVCKNNKPIIAVGFKYVMSNYKQNANNYFENMLGETANIRSNNIPYFQIIIIPKIVPYFDKKNIVTKWEEINEYNIKKYAILSHDDTNIYFHTPLLTLLYIIDFEEHNRYIKNKEEYKKFYNDKVLITDDSFKNNHSMPFGSGVIVNNFEYFINKVCHYIKFKL